jgi:acyl-CoA thioesterase FadM
VVLWVARLGSSSVVTPFELERAAESALLVEGEVRQVFVDAESSEKREMPPRVREGLERHLVEEPEQVTP